MISHDRFFDALSRTLTLEQRTNLNRLLIVGPGTSEPIDRFLELFPQASLTLIEVDHEALTKLTEKWGTNDRISIFNAAADALSLHFDLAVIRHPDVARFSERWQSTFATVIESLTDSGLLAVSAYSLPEATFINQAVSAQPVDLLSGSPYSPLSVDLQGNDRYILIFRKVL
jgi:hypothetical protein